VPGFCERPSGRTIDLGGFAVRQGACTFVGCGLLLVLAVAPTVARGQSPARMSLPPHPSQVVHSVRTTDGTLSGRIIPIDRIEDHFEPSVSVLRPRSGLPDSLVAHVRTKSDGRFQFGGVASGPAVLVARAIGYRSQRYQVLVEPAGDSLVVIYLESDPYALTRICATSCPPEPPRGTYIGSVRCDDPELGIPPELTVEARRLSGGTYSRSRVDSLGQFTLPEIPEEPVVIVVRQRHRALSERPFEPRGDLFPLSPFVLRCEP
jgi:hypothetical protein